MSAYIVEMNVIRYMLDAADRAADMESRNNRFSWFHQGHRHTLTENNPAAVGQMLWNENRKSVLELYQDNPAATAEYSKSRQYVHPTAKTPFRLEHVQALKTLRCYTYQSDGHPGWKDSEARAFTKELRNLLIRTLPGYDEAVWGAPTFSQGIPQFQNAE